MKIRLTAIALVIAFLGAFVAAPLATTAAPNRGTGTATLDRHDRRRGTHHRHRDRPGRQRERRGRRRRQRRLHRRGTAPSDDFAAEIVGAAADAGCQILTLNLGPLFLDLLGLQVDLSQIDPRHHRGAGPGQPARQPAVRGRRAARRGQRLRQRDRQPAQPAPRPPWIGRVTERLANLGTKGPTWTRRGTSPRLVRQFCRS